MTDPDSPDETRESEQPLRDHIEKFGGGHIESRHGFVNLWLVVVYAILFVWAVYYGFTHWGGLGPGLDY